MGDIADDIMSGACCQECNVYFVAPHGHPVLCHECWREYTEKERVDAGYMRAANDEL